MILCLSAGLTLLPSSTQAGSKVRCAMLIYGGTHTSRCFSDEFLSVAQKETTIATERRFKTVKLDADELFEYPFVVMTGEGEFHFTSKERENLKKYLENGGFLLASAGCSSDKFKQAFVREMKAVLPDNELTDMGMDSPIFRTVYTIESLVLKSPVGTPKLQALEIGGKTVVVFSPHGLNDTANTEGCCCCGGNEIKNSLQVNVNILAYALLY
ncbi:MAG: DUF4159 domain-containing protein [Verrucomicrobiota bacterium]